MSAFSAVRRETEPFLATHRELDGGAPPWVLRLRDDGIQAFSELGFPTTKLEDWKYTSVAPIAALRFRRGEWRPLDERARAALEESRIHGGAEIVFVNGHFAPELSSKGALASGVVVTSLAEALGRYADVVEQHLSRHANVGEAAFTALNTAFLEDGAFVHVPRGVSAGAPVHLLFASLPAAQPVMSCPRVLIVADEAATVEVVESHLGLAAGRYWTNAVTEISVGPGASVGHYKVQRESEQAFHVARIEAHQEADSRLASSSTSLGAALARIDVRTVFDAEGSECRLDGLYMAHGQQHVDHHTTIDHLRPRCASRELYKGVLEDRATGVFNGKVLVRPDAQKSDAQQVNKNLLLSKSATIDTKPELEIFADDVKCSHGATIGRLDEKALFYLRSRGIGEAEARDLLIAAFANEMVDRVPIEPLRAKLGGWIAARLGRSSTLEVSS